MNPNFKATTVRIGADFSRVPAGRFYSDGPNSGQRFREEILVPCLRDPGVVVIDLDDTEGYGSSFLEESFGGLVREEGFDKDALLRRFSFKSEEDPSLIPEITGYIRDAQPRA